MRRGSWKGRGGAHPLGDNHSACTQSCYFPGTACTIAGRGSAVLDALKLQGRRVAGGPARYVCSVWFNQSSEHCPGRRNLEEGEGKEGKGGWKEERSNNKGRRGGSGEEIRQCLPLS